MSPPRGTVFVPTPPPVIRVAPGATRLNLKGANLLGEAGPATVKLNNRLLEVAEADNDRLAVHLPSEFESGALEVNLPDGNTVMYELSVMDADQWAPNGDRS